MKFLKNSLLLVLALAMVLCLCACAGNEDNKGNETTAGTTAGTTEATEQKDDGKVTYTVKVVDEAGNPIEGAMVQLCLESCMPGKTDASGVATYNAAEAEYKVSFMMMPAGYTADQTEYHFADGSYELTITLKKAA